MPANAQSITRILITGASSGLGTAFAAAYAQKLGANAILALCGRNEVALHSLADQLKSSFQSTCVVYPADVRNAVAMQAIANNFMQAHGTPHIIIANAGVSRGTLTEHVEDIAAFQAVFETNLLGMVHTFQPFIEAMKIRRQLGEPAQLVGIASVAGIRGLPGSGAYSASKAAAITYLESLRIEMQQYNIPVTTIAPGYIRTPMTAVNTYRMPFLMDAETFATHALRAIAAQRRFTIIPWQMGLIARCMRLIPASVWDVIMKNAPHKARHTAE